MYDLIVIGAGPAGSAAAREAGRQGLKVLIIERAKFPRYKPCGGAFSEHAISYLDFDIPQHIIEKEIYGARVHFKGQVLERHKSYRIATIVTRSILDSFLLEKALETGPEARFGENVMDLRQDMTHVEVHTNKNTYKGKFIIIAEGAQGRFKYLVRRRDRKNEYGICIVTEIEATDEEINAFIQNAIDIHFGVAGMGYGWIFPKRGCFNVGIGGFAKYLDNPNKMMKDFLSANGFTGKYKMRGHVIPAGGIRRTLVKHRIVLTGDSAGFVDSFYGEGIAYAIRSGQIAAGIISDIINNDKDINSLKLYERECEKEFGHNLRYSLKLAKLMHYWPGVFLKIFTSNEEVLDKYLDVPCCKLSYKDFLKWLLPRIPGYLFKAG